MTTAAVAVGEFRQAWRGLLRRPAFFLLATFTLALGLGAVTAMFALLDKALLQPLPFPHADRLVTLGFVDSENPSMNSVAPVYYARLKAISSVESAGMAMGGSADINIAPDDHAEVATAWRADRDFVATFGLPMAIGRNFDDAENRPNGPRAVILSDAFWRSRFRADPSVVGRTLQVEGKGMQIVGVLPKTFRWPQHVDLIVSMQPDLASTDSSMNQMIVARLKPGATVAGASAETASVMTSILIASSSNPERMREALANSQPPAAIPITRSIFASTTGNALWLFLGAAVCVLSIAVVNLAGLVFLRSLSRTHASAVRAALGSSMGRLSLPAFAEGLLIGIVGAAGGLVFAWIGLRLLGGFVPPAWLRGEDVSLTGTSVAFAGIAGIGAAMAATLLAVVRGRRREWRSQLVGGGRGGLSREDGRLGRVLVVAQIAVAVVLLVGAALFTRTLRELQSVPMGFASHGVTTFTLSPVKARYPTSADVAVLARGVIDRLLRSPGVEAAGASTNLPTGTQLNWPIVLPNHSMIAGQYRIVSPGFLDAVGIPLLAGRGIAETDASTADPVCVVSASFAREYFGGDAIGHAVTMPAGEKTLALRIVGVVGDVRQFGPAEMAPPIVYTALNQVPPPIWATLRDFGPLSFALRLHPGVGLDDGALRKAVEDVAPGQPISNVRTLDAVVASTTDAQRLNLMLVGLFAGLALLLASVGLYAVMSVGVAAHRHDYGVRAALGATRRRLLLTVLRSASVQVGLGLAIGLALAMAVSRLLASFLFGVKAFDPLAIGSVLLVLGTCGLLASLPPAWRAARVKPMQALRVD
ncbi:ADOP family duplicated permease [Luteibacter aegosomatis]|uniref:ADOP family duplicated permease n=1 Tax=Luteibacter aegosomatis TaxID=2911537 RepID=UPI001FFB4869|nr:ADOP family duplicated permease [Luteibacter aegosomatis]UPG84009.1 ADOP family duplicated permease [Luteibacter aegosomatis]